MGPDVAAIWRLHQAIAPCLLYTPIPSSSSHPGGRSGRRDSQWLCGPNALTKCQSQTR